MGASAGREIDTMNKTLPPYHLGQQYASALLRPVAASLADLEARLTQYVERMPMSDDDRAAMFAAQSAVAQAKAEVERLAQRRQSIPPRE